MLASAAQSQDASEEADLAGLFPDLELGARLGSGATGLLYEARQRALDRRVALKLVRAQDTPPAHQAHFEREALALGRLNHPHTVALFDVGKRGGWFYLMLELVEGEDLARRLQRGPLPAAEALKMALQVCEALAHAHASGVIHRDVKPANVLLDRSGSVKLADFGLARIRDAAKGVIAEAPCLGTPEYMSPEQRRDPAGADERADLYALGVMLYEMLTGRLPEGRFPSPSPSGRVLEETVSRAMAAAPEARFQSAQAMHAALESAMEVTDGERRRRTGRRVLALAAVLVVLAVVVWRTQPAPAASRPPVTTPLVVPVTPPAEPVVPTAKPAVRTIAGRTAIHAAVLDGDLSGLLNMPLDEREINQADSEGWTPLLLAVARDRVDLLEALVARGAKRDTALPGGNSAMHIAAGYGAIHAAAWLKAKGSPVGAAAENHLRPLDWAAALLQPEMVRWLVKEGAALQQPPNAFDPAPPWRPLHLAVDRRFRNAREHTPWPQGTFREGDEPGRARETVLALLELGVEINDADTEGLMPLHRAAACDDAVMVGLLIDHGADPNFIPPPHAISPVAAAAATNAVAAMRVLFARGALVSMPLSTEPPLSRAARAGHLEAATLLLEHGAHPAERDLQQLTSLHRAAAGGHTQIVELLLKHGAPVDAYDSSRHTPLHYAAAAGRLEAVRLLCASGASVTARAANAGTARDLAVHAGHPETAAFLANLAARQSLETAN